ncbi:general odorant-binding protein 28a-like [Ostrinia nubilalis]|uniref:general odorant-binding protein 28a-like n=1 Tax=Ostrinia furnacalis TaxID=93504 RepID=UPI001039DBB4|nr:general odorant-binding protein 28a-like [Ostrinia furnacalis]
MATRGVFFVLCACVLQLALSLTEEHKVRIQATFETVGEKCAKENNITEEVIAAFKSREFPEGQEAACFSACVLKNIGLIDDEGQLSRETAVTNAKDIFGDGDELKAIEDFIETCKDSVVDGADACERAKLVFKCFVEHSEKYDF